MLEGSCFVTMSNKYSDLHARACTCLKSRWLAISSRQTTVPQCPKKINQSVLRIDMFIFSKEWPSVWGRRTLRLAKLERKKRDSMTVGSVIGGKNNDDDDVNDAIGNACRLQWGKNNSCSGQQPSHQWPVRISL